MTQIISTSRNQHQHKNWNQFRIANNNLEISDFLSFVGSRPQEYNGKISTTQQEYFPETDLPVSDQLFKEGPRRTKLVGDVTWKLEARNLRGSVRQYSEWDPINFYNLASQICEVLGAYCLQYQITHLKRGYQWSLYTMWECILNTHYLDSQVNKQETKVIWKDC